MTAQPQYYGHARPEVQALVPPTAKRILDVGCGAGILGAALKQRQTCEVWGVEYVADVARQAALSLDQVITGSVEDMAVLEQLPDDYFDVIIFADVLEHLRDPGDILQKMKPCLRAGGTIVSSVPNVRHWSVIKGLLEGRWDYEDAGILDRTHLRFFTCSSLVSMFRDAGYEIAEGQTVRLVNDVPMPTGIAAALANFGVDTQNLEEESQVYQFLLVSRPLVEQNAVRPPQTAMAPQAVEAEVVAQTDQPDEDPIEVNLVGPDPVRPDPEMAAVDPVASLVVLTRNQLEYTRSCIESIFAHTKTSFELIVVDNGSTDGTIDYLNTLVTAGHPLRVIANPINLGFGAGNNQGIAVARGQYVALLNNDLVLTEGWLERMIGHAETQEHVGIVGPVSNNVSGPQKIPGLEFTDYQQMHTEAARIAATEAGKGFLLPRVVGFCMVIKRAVIDAIGGFDERFGLGNFEDDDLCWRAITAGYGCFVASDTYVHHYGSRTFVGEKIDHRQCMESAWSRFKEKWGIDASLPLGEMYRIPQQAFDRQTHHAELPKAGIVPVDRPGETEAQHAERYNSWGERMYALDRQEDARAYFERALDVNDGCANALNNLGVLAVDKNDVAQAAGFLERSVLNDQGNANTLWNLISLYVHLGKDREATPLVQEYLQLNPGHADAVALLDELQAVTAGAAPLSN